MTLILLCLCPQMDGTNSLTPTTRKILANGNWLCHPSTTSLRPWTITGNSRWPQNIFILIFARSAGAFLARREAGVSLECMSERPCHVWRTKWKPGVLLSTACHPHSVRREASVHIPSVLSRGGTPEEHSWWLWFQPPPVCGRDPSGCAAFACTNPRPVTCAADWFLAPVNNSSESNVRHAPSIMHCLPSKQPGWEMILKWNGRHGMDGIVAALSLGPGHHWHPPAPRTGCPAPFVSRGQSKDDKKQMEMLAPGPFLVHPCCLWKAVSLWAPH